MGWADPLGKGRSGKNRWRAGYRDSAGNKRYVKDATGKTIRYDRKSDARLAANEAEVKANRQAPSSATTTARITWGEWWERIGGNRHPFSDFDRQEGSLAKSLLIPQWGDTQLNLISNKSIKEWIKSLKLRYSAYYVRLAYGLLRSTMQEAVDAEILTATPCTGNVGLPKVYRRSKQIMTAGDLRSYGDALRPDYLDVIEFSYETGLRPSEVCGLHANRINFDIGWLDIAEVLVAGKRAIRPFPKDKESRPISLTDKAIEILARKLEGRDLKRGCGLPHLDGKECRSELVFRSRTGSVIIPANVNDLLKYVAKRDGFERKTPYAARRAFATWATEGGMDSMAVQKMMGHSTTEQTEDYVQLTSRARARLQEARDKAHRSSRSDFGAELGADMPQRTTKDTGTTSDEKRP